MDIIDCSPHVPIYNIIVLLVISLRIHILPNQLFENKDDDINNINTKIPTLKRVSSTVKLYDVFYKQFNGGVLIHAKTKSSESGHQVKIDRKIYQLII